MTRKFLKSESLTTQLALAVDCDAAALGNYCTDDLSIFWPEEIIKRANPSKFSAAAEEHADC